MKDGIPQLAGEVDTTQKLYAYLSDQLDILNGVLSETGANYSFQYGNDGGHFQVQKISPDETEEIGSIESLGHNDAVNDELYTTGFAQNAVVRRSAVGVLTFAKMRLIKSIDMDTKIKMSGVKAGSVPAGLAQIVLQGIENDPWKIIHEKLGSEVGNLNGRLKQVDAPFRFETLYDRDVLILSKIMKDGGAETAVIIEPVETLPAYRISFEDVSTELSLDGAVARTRERIKTLLPDDVRADLLRLRLAEMETAQGTPQNPAP